MPRSTNQPRFEQPFVYEEDLSTVQSNVDAFRRRQQEDLKRYDQGATTSAQSQSLHEQYGNVGNLDRSSSPHSAQFDDMGSGGEGWRDSEGDRLDDFGVDEDAELHNEDNIPLIEWVRRRHERIQHVDGR